MLPFAIPAFGWLAIGIPLRMEPMQSLLLPILTVFAAPLAAQSVPLQGAFDAPIHAADEDGSLWASRDAYKVDFGVDGPMFYPVLGADAPEHLPVGWRTTAVTADGEPLPIESTATRHDDWRLDYDRGSWCESYDVRADGLEQSFLIRALPAAGDLVIRGELTGALHAKPRSPRHDRLELMDANGRTIAHYGEAIAVDAAGRETTVTTAVSGDTVELRVDGAWLAGAELPVTVDPLLAAHAVASGVSPVLATAVAHDDINNELLFVYARAVTTSDQDIYARIAPDDFSTSYTVYTDLLATVDTSNPSCAFVGATRRFVAAFERTLVGSTYTSITVAVIPARSRSVTSMVLSRAPASSTVERHPAVGGTYAQNPGNYAAIAYEVEYTSTPQNTRVYAMRFDSSAVVWQGPPAALSPNGVDAERPAINQTSLGGTAPWFVVWQEYGNVAGDDLEIHGTQFRPNGTAVPSLEFGRSTTNDHSFAPKIGGNDGRYLIAFVASSNGGSRPTGTFGSRIEAQRIDWPDFGGYANYVDLRTLRSSGGGLLGGVGVDGISYDEQHRSHWNVLVRDQFGYLNALRVGYELSIAETAYVNDGGVGSAYASGITDVPLHDAVIGYGTSGASDTVYGRFLVSPQILPALSYGTSCGPTLAQSDYAWAGNEFFGFDITSAPTSILMVAISLAPGSVPLNFIGMGTCTLAVGLSPSALLGVFPDSGILMGSGVHTYHFPFPLPAPLSGSIFCQAITSGPTPLGLLSSNGIEVRIR